MRSLLSLKHDAGPSVVSLITVLRLLTLLSGVAVAANEWSHYKDGKICSRYLKPQDTYYICAETHWQLAVLTATRVSAGAVLACLVIVFFTKVSPYALLYRCAAKLTDLWLSDAHMRNDSFEEIACNI
jgi:hypothetical protein